MSPTAPHAVTVTRQGDRYTARHVDGRNCTIEADGTLTLNGRACRLTLRGSRPVDPNRVRSRVRDLYHCRIRGYPNVTMDLDCSPGCPAA